MFAQFLEAQPLTKGCLRGLKAALIVLVAGLLISPASLAEHDDHDHGGEVADEVELGEVDFRVDCMDGVREDFDRALALMHHMMYAQARGAFADLKDKDPECAMAYWGVATTLFQPLWGTRPSEDELKRGWKNIQKAAELADEPREKALVDATHAFFKDPDSAEFWDRLNGWIDGMAAAHNDFPDDLDITSLHGLALLTKAQEADDHHALHDEAEPLLRAVWEQERKHPGAIHYSIHATDADGRAKNALDMVEIYAQIAPNTAHALHMPSHIYVRLGDWPQVIEWNEQSAEAALDHPANDSISHHFIHAIDYIIYARLQRGEDELAREIHNESTAKGRHEASFVNAFHFAAMPARLAVEGRKWEEAVDLEVREPDYLPWDQSHWPEGMTWYARGLAAAHTGDLSAAEEAKQEMARLREEAREAGERRMATYIEVDRLILSGWIAHARDDGETAVEQIRSALELEGTVEKHPVTPGALLPPGEALGDLLMALNRPDEAFEAYRESDETWPGRYNTLLGMARAARQADKPDQAEKAYQRLLDNAGESDRDGVAEARQALADLQ